MKSVKKLYKELDINFYKSSKRFWEDKAWEVINQLEKEKIDTRTIIMISKIIGKEGSAEIRRRTSLYTPSKVWEKMKAGKRPKSEITQTVTCVHCKKKFEIPNAPLSIDETYEKYLEGTCENCFHLDEDTKKFYQNLKNKKKR